jgi:hypothetical protein
MAKTIEKTEHEGLAEIRRVLDALAPGETLPRDEWLRLVGLLPKAKPGGPTSAEIIRELRGPLPEDDPEFQRNRRR